MHRKWHLQGESTPSYWHEKPMSQPIDDGGLKLAESEGLEPPKAINPNGFQDRPTTIITTLHKL